MEPDTSIELVGRLEGPLHFRLFLQPLVASIFGLLDGKADAKAGNPPYFWSMTKATPQARRALIRHGWERIGKVFILAVALDCTFQFIVNNAIAILPALLVAAILAILPYLLFRGFVNRFLSR